MKAKNQNLLSVVVGRGKMIPPTALGPRGMTCRPGGTDDSRWTDGRTSSEEMLSVDALSTTTAAAADDDDVSGSTVCALVMCTLCCGIC